MKSAKVYKVTTGTVGNSIEGECINMASYNVTAYDAEDAMNTSTGLFRYEGEYIVEVEMLCELDNMPAKRERRTKN